jgi:hypothetical protein
MDSLKPAAIVAAMVQSGALKARAAPLAQSAEG